MSKHTRSRVSGPCAAPRQSRGRPAAITAALFVSSIVLSPRSVPCQAPSATHEAVELNRSSNPLLSSFRFRSIGPASVGGRLDDIEVAPSDPNVVYLGFATGGVFKSTNNTTTFQPVFERYSSASIGDIAIHPKNPDIVYVGTGEANNRQTSSFGDGVYKTSDGGKTFRNIGLRETQTIGRIVIDAHNPDIVYVAALGPLFGPSPDRGVYKTSDGGATWTKAKYVDENTGFTDIAIDPSNSSVLYAASYERRRTGCCYNGYGAGSALWKSSDAGKSWKKLTGRGLPPGDYGRIAIDIARSNPKVVYAQIEVAPLPGAAAPPRGGAARRYDWCNNAAMGAGADSTSGPRQPDATRSGVFRSDDRGETWRVAGNCDDRPEYFSQLRVDPNNENTVYAAGLNYSKSTDGAKSFAKMDSGLGFNNNMVDQHALWIDPRNSRHLLRGSDAGLSVSWDQGETWEYVRTMAVAQAYWVSADYGHPYYLFIGFQDTESWAGPSATRGRMGIPNDAWFHMPPDGDGFQTAADPNDLRTVYTERQSGILARTDLRAGLYKGIRPVAPKGAETAPAPPSITAATGIACVNGRLVSPSGEGGVADGQPNVVNGQAGESYRFTWNAPLVLSPHDSKVLWFGGNKLFRSDDRGDTWIESAELTKPAAWCSTAGSTAPGAVRMRPTTASAPGSLTAIAESPVTAGIVWAGTDDGNLQVSRDGGRTFEDVSKNLSGLPSGALAGSNPYWIARVEASHFDAASAYVAIDGHRANDLKPYIFVTHDYGRSFRVISGGLPQWGHVNVVREDPRNRDLLFAGTEFGMFASLDAGATWERFMNNLPTVRVDDILIHPRDRDLILATHGRSLWIADDITSLEQLTPEVSAREVTLFDVRPAIEYVFDYWTDANIAGDKQFFGENPRRGAVVQYLLRAPASGDARLSIVDASGRAICTSTVPSGAGIHRVQWTLTAPALAPRSGTGAPDLACDDKDAGASGAPSVRTANTSFPPERRVRAAPGVPPGTYTARLTVGGHDYEKPIKVLEDVWLDERGRTP